jgi:BlaI family penicillinase repressor
MKNVPKISDAEWTVMKVLWEKAPLSASKIIDALKGHVTWSPRTIKTLLNRLVKKGALGFTQEGRIYHYKPIVDETDCARAERSNFLSRVYGGSLTPMLTQFIEDEELTSEEIEALKAILDKKGRDEG